MTPTKDTVDSTDEILSGCGWAIIMLLISPVTTIWRGYVLSILWRWFIVTEFDAKPLGIAAAIGVSYVVSFLTFQYSPCSKSKNTASEKAIESICACMVHPAFALAFGYIVHFYI